MSPHIFYIRCDCYFFFLRLSMHGLDILELILEQETSSNNSNRNNKHWHYGIIIIIKTTMKKKKRQKWKLSLCAYTLTHIHRLELKTYKITLHTTGRIWDLVNISLSLLKKCCHWISKTSKLQAVRKKKSNKTLFCFYLKFYRFFHVI